MMIASGVLRSVLSLRNGGLVRVSRRGRRVCRLLRGLGAGMGTGMGLGMGNDFDVEGLVRDEGKRKQNVDLANCDTHVLFGYIYCRMELS